MRGEKNIPLFLCRENESFFDVTGELGMSVNSISTPAIAHRIRGIYRQWAHPSAKHLRNILRAHHPALYKEIVSKGVLI